MRLVCWCFSRSLSILVATGARSVKKKSKRGDLDCHNHTRPTGSGLHEECTSVSSSLTHLLTSHVEYSSYRELKPFAIAMSVRQLPVPQLRQCLHSSTRIGAPSRRATPLLSSCRPLQTRRQKSSQPESGKNFTGQLYESTYKRLERERAEQRKFSQERGESRSGRQAALTFGMSLSSTGLDRLAD